VSIESIEVVVLQAGSEIVIARWHEAGPGVTGDEWKKLAVELAQRASTHHHFRAEIFLCLHGDYLVGRFDYALCHLLSGFARKYGWGAKLYISADERIDLHLDQFHNLPSLVVWLDIVSRTEDRPTDFALANFDRDQPTDDFIGAYLRRAGDESTRRFDSIPNLIAPHKWYCWAASNAYADWIKDLTEPDALNIIAVIRDDRKATMTRLEEEMAAVPGRRFVVAYLGKKDVTPRVVELCEKLRLPLLRFRGLLELRYFLLRLNRLSPSKTEALSQTVEAVPMQNRVFQPGVNQRPRLLITSGFNPAGIINCLDAAEDAAYISRRAPGQAECVIYPAVRQADLPMVVRQIPELIAWVLLAHGDEFGVRDVSGSRIDLEDCFARLVSYRVRLPLVFISACRSTNEARKFAQAGVGVAIGFENDVLPELCRSLAVPVVNAAINSHGNQKIILQVYNDACRELEAIRVFNPKAFYSV